MVVKDMVSFNPYSREAHRAMLELLGLNLGGNKQRNLILCFRENVVALIEDNSYRILVTYPCGGEPASDEAQTPTGQRIVQIAEHDVLAGYVRRSRGHTLPYDAGSADLVVGDRGVCYECSVLLETVAAYDVTSQTVVYGLPERWKCRTSFFSRLRGGIERLLRPIN